MGFAERQFLIELDVLLNVQTPLFELHAEIVHRDVVARSRSPHAVKETFGSRFVGNGVNDHVGTGQDSLSSLGGGAHHVAGVREGGTAR